MENQEKVSLVHSISFKIVILITSALIVTQLSNVFAAKSRASAVMGDLIENYILSIAEQGAQTINSIPPQIACIEEYSGVIMGLKMNGVSSAYA